MKNTCYGFRATGFWARIKLFFLLLEAANQVFWTGKTIIQFVDAVITKQPSISDA